MTIGMVWLHRLLPPKQRYSLPPREITMDLMKILGIHKKLGPEARAALTLINHFGYGAAAAILYSFAEWRVPASSVVKGPIFGALVWLVSYLGLLPALGVLEPATKHPHSRNALMFAVHLCGVFS
jgi:putative membrane protein